MEQHGEAPAQDTALGSQIMIDFYGCKSRDLDDLEWVENASIEAAGCAGVAIVDVVFHRLKPHGIAGVIINSDSQLTVRTWPNHRYAAVDIFTQDGSFDSDAAIAQLSVRFGCGVRSVATVQRGKSTDLIGYPAAKTGMSAPASTWYRFQF